MSLDPASRLRVPIPAGAVVHDGSGQPWHLKPVPLCAHLDPVRDRLYDQSVLGRPVDLMDVRVMAFAMLGEQYRLSKEEMAAVVLSARQDELAEAVFAGLFVMRDYRRTFTGWLRGSLWANGTDPESVPGEDLPHVIRILQLAGKTVPVDEYTEADEAGKMWGMLAGMATAEAKPSPAQPTSEVETEETGAGGSASGADSA